MFKNRIILLIYVLLSLLLLLPALASAEPMLPAAYWGSVKYNDGVSVPSGTLEAVVDGVVCGSIAFSNGFYGEAGTGRKLVVQGNNLEPGKTVYFRVNTGGVVINAAESVDWQSGDTRPVNLTLQSASPAGGSNGSSTNQNSNTNQDSSTNQDNSTTSGGTTSGSTTSGGTTSGSTTSGGTTSGGGGGSAAPVGTTTPSNNPAHENISKTYSDVPSSHWAYADIQFMAAKHIMVGVGDDSFAPEENMTRAQFAAMLVRAMGLSTDGASVAFKDVTSDKWYYREVAAAFQSGLVSGYNPDEFGPEDTVTREQIAAILVRALIKAGKLQPVATGEIDSSLAPFKDRANIDDWARESAAAAIKAGLVKGRSNDTFAPQATATRAEGATLLKRFMQAGGLL
ncbi:S-layer homology domain-containing protein [Pelotomaculum isophthalicicum JI]|uniref:S-layer homology domain-containing protein n=1 Tax=Pelotomaculum isophthalicicum JI TaxID=947010 RepID=A0A9X4JUQ7_9FIRM|nr:S-layer homology domain-containing protein [Pelotomaculum isophthalicicum]MDF9406776.1 S-layer homology domain-containing protein [Pelotomaculum isophthalicicum JI]